MSMVDDRNGENQNTYEDERQSFDNPLHRNDSLVVRRYLAKSYDNGLCRNKMGYSPDQKKRRAYIKQDLIHHGLQISIVINSPWASKRSRRKPVPCLERIHDMGNRALLGGAVLLFSKKLRLLRSLQSHRSRSIPFYSKHLIIQGGDGSSISWKAVAGAFQDRCFETCLYPCDSFE